MTHCGSCAGRSRLFVRKRGRSWPPYDDKKKKGAVEEFIWKRLLQGTLEQKEDKAGEGKGNGGRDWERRGGRGGG